MQPGDLGCLPQPSGNVKGTNSQASSCPLPATPAPAVCSASSRPPGQGILEAKCGLEPLPGFTSLRGRFLGWRFLGQLLIPWRPDPGCNLGIPGLLWPPGRQGATRLPRSHGILGLPRSDRGVYSPERLCTVAPPHPHNDFWGLLRASPSMFRIWLVKVDPRGDTGRGKAQLTPIARGATSTDLPPPPWSPSAPETGSKGHG